ncbi:hypothetical protein ACIBAG_12195 [Streptomyces sp. NPDC051243]|uniref:hypothetical protein n=1 Tax=Streptomyces sp. NPDC051243 TaxID=3365646 RepID=UPI0037BC2011
MARLDVPTWLTDAMDRELYRHNAFRISGLAVTATPRAVRRRVSEARAAEALGAERSGGPAAGESRWLPPDPAPDHIAVREALRRLEDPVRRVVDEFFWFWPLPESDGAELKQARNAWERLAGSRTGDAGDPGGARSIAVHNLAVLHHAEALESKAFYGAGTRRTLWERAYRYWRLVLEDDGCWHWMDERIRVLDDPRLRVVDGTVLREALPAVLLDLHAQLAVDAARSKGGEDVALQHVSLMWGFTVNDGLADSKVVNDATVDAALRRVTAPLAAAVRQRTEAIPGPGADPATLDRAADSLLTETRADVRVLRTVLGPDHPVPADAADEVATAVNACAVACANGLSSDRSTARDPRVSRAAAHLRSARMLAASGHVRDLVEQNLAVLLSNDILLDCKEAVERGERSPRGGAERASRLLDTVEPRLRELRELRPHAPETNQVRDAVAMAVCRLYTEYVNTTRDIDKALAGYRRVLPHAVAEEARSVIRQNIDTLTRAAAARSPYDPAPTITGIPGQCFRCGRSVGPSEVVTVTRADFSDAGSIAIPCCVGCRYDARRLLEGAGLSPEPLPRYPAGYRSHAAHRGSRRRGGSLRPVVIGLMVLVGALFGGALLVGPETTVGKWLSGGACVIGLFGMAELMDIWEKRKK